MAPRSRSSHESNPTSDCVVAAQYQPVKWRRPRYDVNRRTGSTDSTRTRDTASSTDFRSPPPSPSVHST
ncbi:hypothetical protein [Streptomyces sp. NPDC056549]|uniref:hypothetical protein n=1 Tax=Streptomyces sp. NPDC056549 TaxID=3345864 RepID=UPI0036B2D3A3